MLNNVLCLTLKPLTTFKINYNFLIIEKVLRISSKLNINKNINKITKIGIKRGKSYRNN